MSSGTAYAFLLYHLSRDGCAQGHRSRSPCSRQAAATPTRVERLPNDLAQAAEVAGSSRAKVATPRVLRSERRRVRAASGADRVGLRCEVIAPSLIPEAAGRAAQARQARCDGTRAALSGRGARGGAHSERSGRAGPRRRPLPRDVSARDPQVAPLHPQVPGPPGLRVSRGNELVRAAPEVAASI